MSTICSVVLPPPTVGATGLGLGLGFIIAGVKELNYAYEKEKELICCDNKIHQVSLLIKTLEGKEIGVIQTKDGLGFIAKDINCAVTQAALKKIKQRYSKYAMIHQLQSKGYTKIKEEKLPNGSIRMVVEKWE